MIKLKQLLPIALLVSTGVIFSPIAPAAAYDGMYFTGFVGVSKALNRSYVSADPALDRYDLNNDHGFNIGGAIGYRFNCFRTEFSIAYTKNDDDRINVLDAGTPFVESDSGDQTAITFMVNAYYDFITQSGFVPFIGAGIGAAHVRHDYHLDSADVAMHSDDTMFAYQLILGIGSDITENLRVSLDYRFIGTTSGDFRLRGVGPADSVRVKGNYLNHQINLGLTYFI